MSLPFPVTHAGIAGLGPWELGIVLVIVIVVFGAGKLAGIGGSLGQAIKNFKKAMKDDETDTAKGGKSVEGPKETDKNPKG